MTEEAKARKNEYTKRYKKDHVTTFCLTLNRETESDLIEFLSSIGNKSGYIKAMIRADKVKTITGEPAFADLFTYQKDK